MTKKPIAVPHQIPCSSFDQYTGEFCDLWEGHEGGHQVAPPKGMPFRDPWKPLIRGLTTEQEREVYRRG